MICSEHSSSIIYNACYSSNMYALGPFLVNSLLIFAAYYFRFIFDFK